MGKIIIVGSINKDITLEMKKLPQPGETVIASALKTSLGGKGANQAVTAARMGANVSFIGAIGQEDEIIISQLEKEGIKTEGIARLETNTGSAYISIDETAENNIIVYPGANFAFNEQHLYDNIHLFEESEYCLLQLEVPMNIIRETIKICHDKNIKVILNPAPYNEDIDEWVLENVDYYIPNEVEFLATINESIDKKYDLDWFIDKGTQFANKFNLKLIITLGARGAILFENNDSVFIPVKEVVPLDTTAAGDSFIGAFLAYLSMGKDIFESLNFGSKVASITISRHGAISAIPFKEEI